MSVFTAAYPVGHPDPDVSVPDNIITNHDSACQERHNDAVEITDSLMKNRFSCRYYLPKPVEKKTIEEIIDAARHSPSGNNMQPWDKVYCITGALKDAIGREMVEAHTNTPDAYSAQYLYYPAGPIPPKYAKRRFEFGKHFYAPLHVDHGDLKGRARVSTRNFNFFDAPVAFIFTINNGLTQGSWLDVGYFLQSITIAARARGLETISQEAPAKYQLILRKHLPIGDDEVVALGMSMGYPDLEKVAQFSAKQPKREVSDIVEFCGF
ncbi:Nitroreductase [Mycena sanguinolenta]|uniref:Nitroreductase n=1 Tax=Mycena sanguinolenta TaxID=230812 RepID=A0A8H6YRY1_9AGAR|nr:Nitroreductase [Mycena sanguinolenta]